MNALISKVGVSTFKSQEWLLSHKATKPSTYNATNALGGVLSGEVKIAIMLCIMAGASYLDVLFVYGISTATVYSVFHKAAAWMPSTFQFPLMKRIASSKDEETLKSIAEGFASASGGVFRKCVGALDGVAIKIKCPVTSNLIRDSGNYFCRKGFYALNIQATCDKSRRVLWMSAGHKGSTHDSTAFLETQLFKILEESSDWLHDKGYFWLAILYTR